MQNVRGYKFPEKPQHLGLKTESILRKRLDEVKLGQGTQLIYHPINKPFLHLFLHTFFHPKNPSPVFDFE